MELRHLRYFVAVADALNYRKASEKLNISTPALSKQIKDLESTLRVQLLERNTRGVRLTEAGAMFLEEARRTLAQSEHGVAVARDTAKGQRGQLRVGYVEPVLMGFMPEALKAFRERFPKVEVVLVEMALGEQVVALESGALQVAFTTTGGANLPRGVNRVEVAKSPIRAVVGRHHPMARARRVALADLAREPLLCLRLKKEAISQHGLIIQRVFSSRGLRTQVIKEVEGTEAFRTQLESGLGVSLIASSGGLSRNQALVFKELEDTGADLFVCLEAYWRDASTSRVAANFVDVLREEARRANGRGKRN
jgi:DNA-binding transcriptional LysR family regulator